MWAGIRRPLIVAHAWPGRQPDHLSTQLPSLSQRSQLSGHTCRDRWAADQLMSSCAGGLRGRWWGEHERPSRWTPTRLTLIPAAAGRRQQLENGAMGHTGRPAQGAQPLTATRGLRHGDGDEDHGEAGCRAEGRGLRGHDAARMQCEGFTTAQECSRRAPKWGGELGRPVRAQSHCKLLHEQEHLRWLRPPLEGGVGLHSKPAQHALEGLNWHAIPLSAVKSGKLPHGDGPQLRLVAQKPAGYRLSNRSGHFFVAVRRQG